MKNAVPPRMALVFQSFFPFKLIPKRVPSKETATHPVPFHRATEPGASCGAPGLGEAGDVGGFGAAGSGPFAEALWTPKTALWRAQKAPAFARARGKGAQHPTRGRLGVACSHFGGCGVKPHFGLSLKRGLSAT